MADRKQRIIMIGCGTYAQDNHLPVLRQFREEVELVAVLVGQAQQISVGAALRRAGFDSDFARDFARNVIFAPHEGKLPIDALDTRIAELEREGRKPDGAIVSTISALNYDAVRWCLENRLHVLVEKPATCPSNCAWDREKALQISSQLEALVALANESGLRFLVGAQRRYEDVFKRVRDLDQGIEAIQVTHTLGWKLAARDSALPGKRFDNWRGDPSLSGGKIMHSGYHVLDIVLWWLERTNPEIKLARVHCLFDRFRFGEFLPDGNNHNVEKTAVITIQFFGDTGGHDPSCTASFFMTLAGPHYWKRESYYLVKKDWSRITIEGDRGRGQRTPPTIKTRDYDGSFERVLDADPEAGNDRPTRDFLDGLLGRGPAEETSAAASHVRAAKVVQAAYLSAISGTVQEVCLLHG